MTDPIDQIGLDFSEPLIQELHRALVQAIASPKAALGYAARTGLQVGLINPDQAVYWLWWDLLNAAAKDMGVRDFLAKIGAEPGMKAVGERVQELLRPKAPLDPPAAVDWRDNEEKLTGPCSTLRDVVFLERGVAAARSVVYVVATFPDTRAYGTGFLIGPGLVLTNHHVVAKRKAESIHVQFDFEYGTDGLPKSSPSCPARIVGASERVDWAVLAIDANADLLAGRAPFRLDLEALVDVGDDVFIIQHAGGLPKQLGIGRNQVRLVDDHRVQYIADTLAGSSGAPVCDGKWRVVALHRKWSEAKGAEGEPVEYRNEGVRIGRVLEGIREAKINLE